MLKRSHFKLARHDPQEPVYDIYDLMLCIVQFLALAIFVLFFLCNNHYNPNNELHMERWAFSMGEPVLVWEKT